eukprot:COSAG01_NODE_834_length_13230_cov_18.826746_14_plen_448_part_00
MTGSTRPQLRCALPVLWLAVAQFAHHSLIGTHRICAGRGAGACRAAGWRGAGRSCAGHESEGPRRMPPSLPCICWLLVLATVHGTPAAVVLAAGTGGPRPHRQQVPPVGAGSSGTGASTATMVQQLQPPPAQQPSSALQNRFAARSKTDDGAPTRRARSRGATASTVPTVPKALMERAIVRFVNYTQPGRFNLDLALAGFAPNLTWSFPPSGYPRQISRDGFKQHMKGGYNGTLAWSAELRSMHAAGHTMVVHVCDNYIMKSGRMCNWPNVYWRATFDPLSQLIVAWEDLIPSDDQQCVGQANASAIEAAARSHWRALSSKDIARAMQLFGADASSSYLTAHPNGSIAENLTRCNRSCSQAFYQELVTGYELLSALPDDFNVHGDRVSFSLDIEGYPRHPRGQPANGAGALIARGLVTWRIVAVDGDALFNIVEETTVLEQLTTCCT